MNGRNKMKAAYLFPIAFASFLTASTLASAGQCTTEIEQLQKQLSASDAGMGPTTKPSSADSAVVQSPAPVPGTPITAGTNNTLQGKAASPSDVAKQNQGEKTAAEEATSGKPASLDKRSAQESLAEARKLDEAGKETECQNEITKAKSAFGIQ
jgi:hypothetical protein